MGEEAVTVTAFKMSNAGVSVTNDVVLVTMRPWHMYTLLS
jgi:hypothetical protein